MKCGKEVEADVKSDSFDKIINTANFASFNAYQEYLLEDYHRYLDFSFDKIINTANFASFNAYQEYLLEDYHRYLDFQYRAKGKYESFESFGKM